MTPREPRNVVVLEELWDRLGVEFGMKDGLIEGRDRNDTTALARQVVEGLPKRKVRNRRSEWRGVLLMADGALPLATCSACGHAGTFELDDVGRCPVCRLEGNPPASSNGTHAASQATLAPPDALRFALDAGIARLSRELEQYEHTPKGPARPMVGGRQATSQALTALTALRDVRPDAVLTAAHVAALGGPDEFVRRVVAGAAALEPGHVEHVTWRWGLQWLAQSLDQDLQPVTDKRQTRLAEWWGRMSSPQLGGA